MAPPSGHRVQKKHGRYPRKKPNLGAQSVVAKLEAENSKLKLQVKAKEEEAGKLKEQKAAQEVDLNRQLKDLKARLDASADQIKQSRDDGKSVRRYVEFLEVHNKDTRTHLAVYQSAFAESQNANKNLDNTCEYLACEIERLNNNVIFPVTGRYGTPGFAQGVLGQVQCNGQIYWMRRNPDAV